MQKRPYDHDRIGIDNRAIKRNRSAVEIDWSRTTAAVAAHSGNHLTVIV